MNIKVAFNVVLLTVFWLALTVYASHCQGHVKEGTVVGSTNDG